MAFTSAETSLGATTSCEGAGAESDVDCCSAIAALGPVLILGTLFSGASATESQLLSKPAAVLRIVTTELGGCVPPFHVGAISIAVTGDCENANVARQVTAPQNKAILALDVGMLALYEETNGVSSPTRQSHFGQHSAGGIPPSTG